MSSSPDKRGPKGSRVLKLTSSEHAQLTARGYNVSEATHLGGGRSGDVYRITHYSRPIAVKQVFVEQPVTYRARLLFGEIYAATRVPRHPHIVQFYDVLGFQYGVLIFMELAHGGNLFDYVRGLPRFLTEPEAIRLYLQFGDALRYLHRLGIAHRGVRPDNILLDSSKKVCKLGDFGYSTQAYGPANGQLKLGYTLKGGGICYMAPEDIRSQFFQCTSSHHSLISADVYRAGMTLHFMLHKIAPFLMNRTTEQQTGRMEALTVLLYLMDNKLCLAQNAGLSRSAKRAIARHLEPDPNKRPSMEQILHGEPWFNEGCFDYEEEKTGDIND